MLCSGEYTVKFKLDYQKWSENVKGMGGWDKSSNNEGPYMPC